MDLIIFVYSQIKVNISPETLKQALIKWGERPEDSPDKPAVFCTAIWHMSEVSKFLILLAFIFFEDKILV